MRDGNIPLHAVTILACVNDDLRRYCHYNLLPHATVSVDAVCPWWLLMMTTDTNIVDATPTFHSWRHYHGRYYYCRRHISDPSVRVTPWCGRRDCVPLTACAILWQWYRVNERQCSDDRYILTYRAPTLPTDWRDTAVRDVTNLLTDRCSAAVYWSTPFHTCTIRLRRWCCSVTMLLLLLPMTERVSKLHNVLSRASLVLARHYKRCVPYLPDCLRANHYPPNRDQHLLPTCCRPWPWPDDIHRFFWPPMYSDRRRRCLPTTDLYPASDVWRCYSPMPIMARIACDCPWPLLIFTAIQCLRVVSYANVILCSRSADPIWWYRSLHWCVQYRLFPTGEQRRRPSCSVERRGLFGGGTTRAPLLPTGTMTGIHSRYIVLDPVQTTFVVTCFYLTCWCLVRAFVPIPFSLPCWFTDMMTIIYVLDILPEHPADNPFHVIERRIGGVDATASFDIGISPILPYAIPRWPSVVDALWWRYAYALYQALPRARGIPLLCFTCVARHSTRSFLILALERRGDTWCYRRVVDDSAFDAFCLLTDAQAVRLNIPSWRDWHSVR